MKERLRELVRGTGAVPAARNLAREFLQDDLIWYLGDRAWPPPNLVLLNNALAQTGWTKPPLSETSWVAAVRARLRSVRWEALAADVRPLLESAEDRALLTRETITSLLDQRARLRSTSPLRPSSRGRRGRRR